MLHIPIIGELFSTAYGDAASVSNAASGFCKSGIYPYNRNTFSDEDFLPAEATDRVPAVEPGSECTPSIDTAAVVASSHLSAQSTAQRVETFGQLLTELVTRMKQTPRKRRAVQHTAIVTSSPYKTALETSKTNSTKTKPPAATTEKSGKAEKKKVAGTRRTKQVTHI